MKALSGRQPWWWAILHAGKRIENRVWNTRYRGPILLHAAKGCTADEWEDAFGWMLRTFGPSADFVQNMPDRGAMQRGGIVGRAHIIDVIHPDGVPPGFWPAGTVTVDMRWHMKGQYGFVLAGVESLPFTPWPGARGLFDIPGSAVRA
jgi:hypothetical protein